MEKRFAVKAGLLGAVVILSGILGACDIPIVIVDNGGGQGGAQSRASAPRGSIIPVALFQVSVSKDLRNVLPPGKLHKSWRDVFRSGGGYRLVSQKSVDKAEDEEKDGKYFYWRIADAYRVHLQVQTKKAWKSHKAAKGPVRATMLELVARAGRKDNLSTFRVEGRGLGFDGKVIVGKDVYDKIVAEDLPKIAQQVKAFLRKQ